MNAWDMRGVSQPEEPRKGQGCDQAISLLLSLSDF